MSCLAQRTKLPDLTPAQIAVIVGKSARTTEDKEEVEFAATDTANCVVGFFASCRQKSKVLELKHNAHQFWKRAARLHQQYRHKEGVS
eukprot:m.58166 g.58166  ORF g.58166 m.58166 type:complete len:88 (+) comp11659_c0_seq2:306-569(+)